MDKKPVTRRRRLLNAIDKFGAMLENTIGSIPTIIVLALTATMLGITGAIIGTQGHGSPTDVCYFAMIILLFAATVLSVFDRIYSTNND